MTFFKTLATLCSLAFLCSCLEQYDQSSFWAKLQQEREQAHKERPELKEDGSLPDTGGKAKVILSEEDKAYNNFCSSCHGLDGKGETPAGQALNPKARNFTLASWQESVSDERIFKVIKEGGPSVGLSASMVAWGGVIKDPLIHKLVAKIRAFKQP